MSSSGQLVSDGPTMSLHITYLSSTSILSDPYQANQVSLVLVRTFAESASRLFLEMARAAAMVDHQIGAFDAALGRFPLGLFGTMKARLHLWAINNDAQVHPLSPQITSLQRRQVTCHLSPGQLTPITSEVSLVALHQIGSSCLDLTGPELELNFSQSFEFSPSFSSRQSSILLALSSRPSLSLSRPLTTLTPPSPSAPRRSGLNSDKPTTLPTKKFGESKVRFKTRTSHSPLVHSESPQFTSTQDGSDQIRSALSATG